jgi:hypothetical protein
VKPVESFQHFPFLEVVEQPTGEIYHRFVSLNDPGVDSFTSIHLILPSFQFRGGKGRTRLVHQRERAHKRRDKFFDFKKRKRRSSSLGSPDQAGPEKKLVTTARVKRSSNRAEKDPILFKNG